MASAQQGGSFEESETNNTSNSQFQQEMFNSDAYKAMQSQLSDGFGTVLNQYQSYLPTAQTNTAAIADSSVGGYNQALTGGLYDSGLSTQLMQSLTDSQNTLSNASQIDALIMGGDGNNYADAMRSQYLNDAEDTQSKLLRNLDARSAGAGMSGSSQAQIAQGLATEGIADNVQSNLANLGYQTFDKDLDRKLDIAKQADMNNFGRQELMSNMLNNANSTAQSALNNTQQFSEGSMGGFNPTDYLMSLNDRYSQQFTNPILNSGSSSADSSSKSKGSSGSAGASVGG